MNPAGKVRCNMRKQIELGRDDCNSAEPGDKCGVDQFAMTGRPAVEHDRRPKSRSVAPHTGGSGRFRGFMVRGYSRASHFYLRVSQ